MSNSFFCRCRVREDSNGIFYPERMMVFLWFIPLTWWGRPGSGTITYNELKWGYDNYEDCAAALKDIYGERSDYKRAVTIRAVEL